MTAPLADPAIGLVTCLYRAEAYNWPSRFEALAIATEFAPSTLVAPLFGVSEFGLGSTLAFRRADLDEIGGFAAIADYLADDYQLGRQIHSLGRRNTLSHVVVSTHLASGSWRAAWRHQIAMGAHHPVIARRRIPGIAHHVCDVMGRGLQPAADCGGPL